MGRKGAPEEEGQHGEPELEDPTVNQRLGRVLLDGGARDARDTQQDEWGHHHGGDDPEVRGQQVPDTRCGPDGPVAMQGENGIQQEPEGARQVHDQTGHGEGARLEPRPQHQPQRAKNQEPEDGRK